MAKYRVYSINSGYGDGSEIDYLRTVTLDDYGDHERQLESIFQTEAFNLRWEKVKPKKTKKTKKSKKAKTKTMARKKRSYTKKYTKSKSKNTQKGTARSTKKYKVVMMKPSKTRIKKMYTSKRTEISPKIISFAKSCGCRVMWQVYTYRPSMKAYRLVKSGSATKSTTRVRA